MNYPLVIFVININTSTHKDCITLQIYHYFRMCVLGKRLLKDISISNCTKEPSGELHQMFCPNNTCDPYFAAHNVSIVRGIKVIRHTISL